MEGKIAGHLITTHARRILTGRGLMGGARNCAVPGFEECSRLELHAVAIKRERQSRTTESESSAESDSAKKDRSEAGIRRVHKLAHR